MGSGSRRWRRRTVFARTVDPRIRTRCLACPPDDHPDELWCAWEFTIGSSPGSDPE
ncbi:DUF6125 family protein [Anaeromyxobacter sp. Fw109-5]|uniref:DUF6125 family protein n=1 Tax=Anaeromyxobacter sp. (strain Fw109-5) TaxID=404589 RepID=UPI00350EED9C